MSFPQLDEKNQNIIEGKYMTDMVPLDEIENEGLVITNIKKARARGFCINYLRSKNKDE